MFVFILKRAHKKLTARSFAGPGGLAFNIRSHVLPEDVLLPRVQARHPGGIRAGGSIAKVVAKIMKFRDAEGVFVDGGTVGFVPTSGSLQRLGYVPDGGPWMLIESGAADLRLYQDMLIDTVNQVGAGRKAGLSLEALQAAGLDPKWKAWGEGWIKTEQWIEAIYKSLGEAP